MTLDRDTFVFIAGAVAVGIGLALLGIALILATVLGVILAVVWLESAIGGFFSRGGLDPYKVAREIEADSKVGAATQSHNPTQQ